MNHKKISVLLLIFIYVISILSPQVYASAVLQEESNLFVNGGFEDGVNSWSLQNSGWEFTSVSKEANPTGVRSGNYAAWVPIRSGTSYPYQKVQLQANKTYLTSFAVKLNNNTHANTQSAVVYIAPIANCGVATVKSTLITDDWSITEGVITTTSNGEAYVGVAQYTGYTSFYVDDAYMGELVVKDVNITIDNNQTDTLNMQMEKEAKTFQLGADILNQQGTNYGLENAVVTKWELAEDLEGISINEETGALTLTPALKAESINVRVTITPNFVGAPDNYVFEKTLKVIPSDLILSTNLLLNSGFETGDPNGDGYLGYLEACWYLQDGHDGSWKMEIVKKEQNPEGVRSGNFAASVPVRPGGSFPFLHTQLQGGKTYISSVAVKLKDSNSENPQSAVLFLSPLNNCGTVVTSPESVTLSNEWATSEGVINTTADGGVYVGVTQSSGEASFYVDDAYIGELMVCDANLTVDGVKSNVLNMQMEKEPKVFRLGAQILNQLSTTCGLSQSVQKWELKENINGISIDEETGKLTVTPGIQVEKLHVSLTVAQNFDGAPSKPYVIEKILNINSVNPIVTTNLIKDGSFEDGDCSEWTCDWDRENGISVMEGKGYTGNYGLYVSPKSNVQTLFWQPFEAKKGKTYLLSSMIKLADKDKNGAKFQMYTGTDEAMRPYATLDVMEAVEGEWRFVGTTFTMTEDATLYISVCNWTDPDIAYYIDDVYLGELELADAEIVGENVAIIPKAGTTDIKLSANLYNQLGTSHGFYKDTTMDEWYIDGDTDGVSINSDGVVSVNRLSAEGSVTVYGKIFSASAENGYILKSFPLEIFASAIDNGNDNLIANGGFEDFGKVYWEQSWNNGVKILSENPYSGRYSAYVSERENSLDKYSQNVILQAGKIYNCSAMVYTGAENVQFSFDIGDSSAVIEQSKTQVAPRGWKRISSKIDTTECGGNVTIQLSLVADDNKAEFYLDDFYLGESELPPLNNGFEADVSYLIDDYKIGDLRQGDVQTKINLVNNEEKKKIDIYSSLYTKKDNGSLHLNDVIYESIELDEYMEKEVILSDSLSVLNNSDAIIKTFICDEKIIPLTEGREFEKSEIPREIFVSPTGKGGDGSFENPYSTIMEARDRIRNIKNTSGLPSGGITVYLRGGEYFIDQSVSFERIDSGTAECPITYRAYEDEEVIFTGGVLLPNDKFEDVTDSAVLSRVIDEDARQKIKQINLKELGITDYGELSLPGAYNLSWMDKNPTQAELFIDDEDTFLARYPNSGYMSVTEVVDPGANPSNWNKSEDSPDYVPESEQDKEDAFVIKPQDERFLKWTDAPSGDVLLFGKWRWIWADQTVPLGSIDTANKTIESAIPSYFSVIPSGRFYAYNLLEEIDTSGEYYIDRTKGILYVYSEQLAEGSNARLSLLTDELISMKFVSDVKIEGITFNASRGSGITLLGCTNVKIYNCTIKNTGDRAVSIGEGCSNCGISGSYIYNTNGGVSVHGGDISALKNADNYVDNCHIEKFSRLTKTYNGAIYLLGSGQLITNNIIHNGPHLAIQVAGTNHKIENNEIYDVLKESDDMSVIYAGGSWVSRGHQIKHNYIHDIYSDSSGPSAGVHAVYLDDCYSGIVIEGNIISDISGYAFLINGGRDNIMQNNIIDNAGGGLYLTDIGLTQDMTHIYSSLDSSNYRSDLWKAAFPALYCILDNEPNKPKGNVFSNNLIVNSGEDVYWGNTDVLVNATGNYYSNDYSEFPEFENDNFLIKNNSIVFNKVSAFKQIPFEYKN